ncbi:MAG: class I SAM-dependent methyltransferase [Oscillospiraceae bacterium]|nr:class I SAM-dependent methyltransferase [Oscillospiraceae bacterium]
MQLSPRLAAVARLILPGSRVADVGTDHGHLPVWLITEGGCPFVVATDVAPGPLDAARRSAARAGGLSGVEFRLADGLGAVSPDEVDTVVIAGMGGETTLGIIERAPWLKLGAHRMILQPQSKVPELLDGLAAAGYRVDDQHLAAETGRMYTMFEVTAGVVEPPVGGLRYVNRALLERGDPLLGAYLDMLTARLGRMLRGLEQAGTEPERRAELARAIADFERWQKIPLLGGVPEGRGGRP